MNIATLSDLANLIVWVGAFIGACGLFALFLFLCALVVWGRDAVLDKRTRRTLDDLTAQDADRYW